MQMAVHSSGLLWSVLWLFVTFLSFFPNITDRWFRSDDLSNCVISATNVRRVVKQVRYTVCPATCLFAVVTRKQSAQKRQQILPLHIAIHPRTCPLKAGYAILNGRAPLTWMMRQEPPFCFAVWIVLSLHYPLFKTPVKSMRENCVVKLHSTLTQVKSNVEEKKTAACMWMNVCVRVCVCVWRGGGDRVRCNSTGCFKTSCVILF